MKRKGKVNFKEALSLLIDGETVALPTETVYGLAGRIDKEKTLEQIFKLKKRPSFDPLIVHCRDKKQALKYFSGNTVLIEQLFDYFSPGPLTLVGKKHRSISPLITATKNTVAIRIPNHPFMQKILKQLPVPLAAPSANLYSKISPVNANHVLSSFNKKIAVLDGGICKKGLESTIVFPDIQKKKLFILRPGIIIKKDFEKFIKKNHLDLTVEYKNKSSQPGGQKSHYKPDVPLYILETHKTIKEIKVFLSKKWPTLSLKRLTLEKSPHQAGRFLYSRLRRLSKNKSTVIFVQKTKQHQGELWETIWDRLNKASSGYYKL